MQILSYGRERRREAKVKPPRRIRLPQPAISELSFRNRNEVELRRALVDKSVKAQFIGGTLAKLSGSNGSSKIECQERITRITLDQEGLRIKTYSKLDVLISRSDFRGSDATFKEVDGIVHISLSFGTQKFVLAPRGLEIN